MAVCPWIWVLITSLWRVLLKRLLMKVKEENEKPGLKLNIQKTKIMVSSRITSWQTDGEAMETVTDFLRQEKSNADGDCSLEIRRCLLLGRKAMTNPDSELKSRDITLPTKVHVVRAMVLLVVMWIRELDHEEGWAPKNWCFQTVVLKKTLENPLGSKEIKQSILKNINSEYSLEGLMLKLKHLMWRSNSLEKTLIQGKTEGRRREWQKMRWVMASQTQWTWVWASSGRWWRTGKPGVLQSMASQIVSYNERLNNSKVGTISDSILKREYWHTDLKKLAKISMLLSRRTSFESQPRIRICDLSLSSAMFQIPIHVSFLLI